MPCNFLLLPTREITTFSRLLAYRNKYSSVRNTRDSSTRDPTRTHPIQEVMSIKSNPTRPHPTQPDYIQLTFSSSIIFNIGLSFVQQIRCALWRHRHIKKRTSFPAVNKTILSLTCSRLAPTRVLQPSSLYPILVHNFTPILSQNDTKKPQ